VKIVLLWSDLLLWGLVLAGVLLVIQVRRREHLAVPWRRVGQSRVAMACLPVLLFFVLVGLLDSIHFRAQLERSTAAVAPPGNSAAAGAPAAPVYSVEVLSALDEALKRLRSSRERTYSAPLATHAYVKESVDRPDGSTVREFPRLAHAGIRLATPVTAGSVVADLVERGAIGALAGCIGWLLVALLVAWMAQGEGGLMAIVRDTTRVRWRSALTAFLVLCVVAGVLGAWALDYHVLGTDKVGQDVLYLALKSVRTALVIGTLTTVVMLPLALALGIAAGYLQGWVDDAVQFVYTTLNSIPSVLLIAAAVLLMQVFIDGHADLFQTTAERADLRLLFLCVILGLTSWTGLARLLRAEALKLRELEYVQAARALGVSSLGIMAGHVARNAMHLAIITLAMEFSGLVLAEAVLSYIGVGVDPSMISFGSMINAARLELSREPAVWWSLAAAFSFMFVLVLAANLLADAVRDAFDPRVTGLRGAR
jgi:peptide/nickel transport system permease protein